MPVEASIITSLGLVHMVCSAQVTMDEIRTHSQNCYARPDYRPGMPEIVDLSQVTDTTFGFDDLLVYVKELQHNQTIKGVSTTVCIVAPDGIPEMMAQMFASLAATNGEAMNIHILPGYPEVLAVLDMPAANMSHFPDFCRTEAHLL